jgi:uncharacterized membrane protein (UPF0136 family)
MNNENIGVRAEMRVVRSHPIKILRITEAFLAVQIIRSDIMNMLLAGFKSEGVDAIHDVEMRSRAVAVLDALLPFSFAGTFELVAIGVILFYYWKNSKGPEKYVRNFLMVFTLFFVLGYTIDHVGSLPIFGICLIPMVILYLGVYHICSCLIWMFGQAWGYFERYLENNTITLPDFSNIVKTALPVFLLQLPLVIIRYPAGIDADGYSQINLFLQNRIVSMHWPVASTVFMGVFPLAGKELFGSYEVGLFIYVLLQTLLVSLVIAYSMKVLKEMGAKRSVLTAAYVGYLFSPFVLSYSTQITKDSVYAYLMLFFIAAVAAELFGISNGVLHKAIVLIAAFLVCISRNNGIYAVSAMVIVLLIGMIAKRQMRTKQHMSLFIRILAACCMYVVYLQILTGPVGLQPAEISEALSIPFQQTARYVTYYPGDVTDEEKEIINATIGYEGLAEAYNPLLSDNIKVRFTGDKDTLMPYFGVWLSQFTKHPLVYFEATLANSVGFYYTDAKLDNGGAVGFCRDMAQESGGIAFRDSEGILRAARIAAIAFFKVVGNIPFMWFLCSTALYNWLSMFLFVREIRLGRLKKVALLAPSIVGIAVCIAGPTFTRNGDRYALPIIFTLFFLIGICTCREEESC